MVLFGAFYKISELSRVQHFGGAVCEYFGAVCICDYASSHHNKLREGARIKMKTIVPFTYMNNIEMKAHNADNVIVKWL